MTKNSKNNQAEHSDAGFTVPELLVVLGIISLLAAVIGPQVIRYLSKAKTDTATAQIRNIEGAVELYYLDVGRYPTRAQGLKILVEAPQSGKWNGPYLKSPTALRDPWGKPYLYKFPGTKSDFDVYSYGRDGAKGGGGEDKDVVSWK